MRGDPSFAGGELRAALRKASFSSFAITGRTTLPESRSRTENDINLHPSLARGHQYGGVAYDCLLLWFSHGWLAANPTSLINVHPAEPQSFECTLHIASLSEMKWNWMAVRYIKCCLCRDIYVCALVFFPSVWSHWTSIYVSSVLLEMWRTDSISRHEQLPSFHKSHPPVKRDPALAQLTPRKRGIPPSWGGGPPARGAESNFPRVSDKASPHSTHLIL